MSFYPFSAPGTPSAHKKQITAFCTRFLQIKEWDVHVHSMKLMTEMNCQGQTYTAM
jgi:hypothetical protein